MVLLYLLNETTGTLAGVRTHACHATTDCDSLLLRNAALRQPLTVNIVFKNVNASNINYRFSGLWFYSDGNSVYLFLTNADLIIII